MQKKWIDSRWFRVLLISALTLGIFFRINGLGNKIYSHDEAYTSLYAAGYRGGDAVTSLWDGDQKSVDDIQKFLKPDEEKSIVSTLSINALYEPHNPPLFFLLEHYWMRLIGYTPARMRGLAAIFGLSSILITYWFSRELFQSSRVAILSTMIFAISPYEILFSQDARPYSLLTLVTMLSSAAMLQAVRRNDSKNWMLYSLTLILGLYSHLLFILTAITHGLYFLVMQLMNQKREFGKFLWACTIAILTFAPWIFVIITRWEQAAAKLEWVNIQAPWYRYVQRWILLFSSPLIDIDLNSDTANILPYFLRALALFFLFYVFLFLLKHGSRPVKLFLSLFYINTIGIFMALDLLLGGIRSISGRYFVSSNIATIMVVAYFLTNKLDQTQNDKSNAKWKYFVYLLLLVGIISNVNSLLAKSWWNKELGRVRAEFISEVNQDRTLLIVSGVYPTNLGDVLLLGFSIDQDVHFKLYKDPTDIEYPLDFQNVYWFPSSYDNVLAISTKKQFVVKNILPGTLWQIVIGNQDPLFTPKK